VRILSQSTLRAFWEAGNALAEGPLKAWYAEVSLAQWTGMADVKARYPSASVVDAERVIFNIHGNAYRLVVKVWFPGKIVYVKFVGTHADYDRLEVKDL
jgi:mRNA interferase HigB